MHGANATVELSVPPDDVVFGMSVELNDAQVGVEVESSTFSVQVPVLVSPLKAESAWPPKLELVGCTVAPAPTPIATTSAARVSCSMDGAATCCAAHAGEAAARRPMRRSATTFVTTGQGLGKVTVYRFPVSEST